jgi:hypothetical protein
VSKRALAVGDIAKTFIANITNRPIYLEIFTNWSLIVGERVASISVPHKVLHAGSSNVLIIKTLKGCGLEIQHESVHILNKVNDFLSTNYFSQIRIIQMDAEE